MTIKNGRHPQENPRRAKKNETQNQQLGKTTYKMKDDVKNDFNTGLARARVRAGRCLLLFFGLC